MSTEKELITQERTQLLNNFRSSLDAIVQKASQDSKVPITEEEPQLEKFCSTMEGILQFGFKHENKDIPLLEDVWNFISSTLKKNSLEDLDNEQQNIKTSNDSINMKKQEITRNMLSIVDYVSNYCKEENEIISSVKIWIQASLVHQVFSLQWQILMNDVKALKDNYQDWAILRTLDDSILISGFLNVFDTINFNINTIPFEILEDDESFIPQKIFTDTMGNIRETINSTLQRTSVHLQKLQQNINDRNIQSLKDKITKNEKEISQLQEEKQKMQQEINALHLTLEAERRLRQHLENELESIHQKVKSSSNNNNNPSNDPTKDNKEEEK
jgi:hypothetical protein